MKARVPCTCNNHLLEIEWTQGDSEVMVGFWVRTGNWMDLWTRIEKAWEVLFHGSALIDDVYIASPDNAIDMANVLLSYANAETKKQDDQKLPSPVAAAIKRAVQPEETVQEEIRINPASLIGNYLSQGAQRKPLPKE